MSVPGRLQPFLFVIAALALLPLATAHTAPAPRDYEVRLIHDCNDDWFGGDETGLNSRDGYDLHALDVREAYTKNLGHHLVFRIILNGEGDSTFTVSMKADGKSKSFTISGSGSSWTGSFDEVKHVASIGDGERFALEGIAKRSTLGIGVGDKLTDYKVVGADDGDTHDSMPGNDLVIGACEDNFLRPDYKLTGPTQYITSSVDEASVTLKVGAEKLVSLELQNRLADMAQTATLSLSGDTSAVRFHDPNTGDYVTTATLDLNKKGSAGSSAFTHVAIEGDAPTSGTVTIEILSSKGGRSVETIDYTIQAADVEPDEPDEPEQVNPGEESPGLPIGILMACLLLARRK